MSQGIVKITPKPAAGGLPPVDGQLQVTVADSNPFGVRAGAILLFPDPGFRVSVGDAVDCTITSATQCRVNKIIVPASAPAVPAGDDE